MEAGARWGRAAAAAALGVPAVVVAHLAVTGTLPPTLAVLAVAAVAILAGALVPARGTLGTAALIGAVQVAGHAAITLTAGGADGGCLPAVGRGAELGVRIGLFGAEGCPPGTFAAGSLSRAALAVLIGAAGILVAHVLVAAAGGLLLGGAYRCAETCAALLRAVLTVPAPLPRIPVLPRRVGAPRDVPLPKLRSHLPVALTHRGPPASVTA